MATESEVGQSGILAEQETSTAQEPSKMSLDKPRSHHKRPMAENEAPKEAEQVSGQDAPLTKETFKAQMQRLTERARAAGLNPIQVMAQTYATQGMAIIEGLLASLENADSSKKKKA